MDSKINLSRVVWRYNMKNARKVTGTQQKAASMRAEDVTVSVFPISSGAQLYVSMGLGHMRPLDEVIQAAKVVRKEANRIYAELSKNPHFLVKLLLPESSAGVESRRNRFLAVYQTINVNTSLDSGQVESALKDIDVYVVHH
jgi:hypothetical protein